MAQPARAVRVRRARSRPLPVSGKRNARPAQSAATPQTERAWNTWLVWLLAMVLPATQRSARAAHTARALLDGAAAPHTPPRAIIAPLRALLRSYRQAQVSLRLAAHLVTVSVVLVAALGAREVAQNDKARALTSFGGLAFFPFLSLAAEGTPAFTHSPSAGSGPTRWGVVSPGYATCGVISDSKFVEVGVRFGSPEKSRSAARYGNWAPGKLGVTTAGSGPAAPSGSTVLSV